MSIRHLKTLVAIADKGSFIDAADAVFITQAAVSMQMKTLEKELEMLLFDRSKRPPVLNEAGLVLVPKARELVRSYEQLMETSTTTERLSGHLSVGSVPTMLTGVLPSALVSLRRSLPQLHISLSNGLSSSLVAQVERGSIDAAVISEPPNERPGLIWTAFGKEPLIVIAPMNSPDETPEQLLKTHPFIRFNRSAWVGKMIDKYLKERNILVKDVMELNTLEAVATMVYHGLGVSVVPHRKILYQGSLPIKRLSFTQKAPERILGVIEREDNPKKHLIDELINELARVMSDT
ncbi:MAG: DNA-binding transcriptional LysR family regulator [Motiliproteus sp.]|jgi:DNA-binding transcriptional LysR family regulator